MSWTAKKNINIIIGLVKKMIDLHTHILPEIDDGASSTEEAYALINKLFEQKIGAAVCTPHFDPSKSELSDFIDKRKLAMYKLKDSPVHLVSGSETVLNEFLFRYSDLTALCFENTRYLLLELPYSGSWGKELYLQIKKLMNFYSVFPVIAHIERYDAVWKNKKSIKRLIEMGCMIQMNASAVISAKRGYKALGLIKKGYVDVLASDCHNTITRPPNLCEAYDRISLYLGSEYGSKLENNSLQILKGKKLRGNHYFLI